VWVWGGEGLSNHHHNGAPVAIPHQLRLPDLHPQADFLTGELGSDQQDSLTL